MPIYQAPRFLSFLLSLILLLAALPMQGNPEDNSRDSFDDLIAFVDDPAITDLITSSSSDITRQSSKVDIITILNEFGILALLEENFFLRTNTLNSRSLLDYPEFIPYRHDKDKRAIYVDLFYNQTSRMNFTKTSGNICTYLGIFQPNFIKKVQNVIQQVQNFFPELNLNQMKILRLLNLAQTFTVQQRRLGFMIGGKAKFNRWHFNIMAPWYYLERNHFVDKNVEDAIEALVEEIMEETLGISQLSPAEMDLAEKQRNAFIDRHLISDKFGIGDTRIYLDYPIIKKKYAYTRLGFLATIPTAFAMKKGLKGVSLSRVKNRPILNLVDIVSDALPPKNEISPEVYDFGLAALDNLGAMILDTPMGNGGHLGIGILARNRSPLSAIIKQDWARRFIMRNFISLEYQFPAVEWRSFRVPVNEALFNAHDFTVTTDQLIINSNYAFILQQLTDRVFPIAIQARVHPGVIFRWSSQMCYEGDTSGFTLGTDTYVRNREGLSDLNANDITKHMIDIFHARAPLSYQSKVVGSVFFKVEKPDRLYTISLIGDYTFMFKGIGPDVMFGINFDAIF